MRYHELTFEAKLNPGEIRAIEVQIQDYRDKIQDLEHKQSSLDDKYRYGNHWPEDEALQEKLSAYINAYTNAIEKLKLKIRQDSETPQIKNIFKAIKKNCSEIWGLYRASGQFLYSGFKNAHGQSILYGRTPARMIPPSNYLANNYEDITWLIEEQFNLGSFDNSIYSQTNSYNASYDGSTPYIIFPLDGFKYFYPLSNSRFRIQDYDKPRIMDRELVMEGWKKFIGDPEMYQKFRDEGGHVDSTDIGDAGYGAGFLGSYHFKNNLLAIGSLAEKGLLDIDWEYKSDWKNWVTKESFQDWFNISNKNLQYTLGRAMDVVINTSAVYAINAHYSHTIRDYLDRGN